MCCLRSASLLTMSIHAGDVIGVLLLRLLHGHAVFGVGIGCQIFRFFQRGGNIDAGKQQREGQQDAARRRVRLVLAQHGDQREKRREDRGQDRREDDIDEQRVVHRPDLAVLPGMDGVDHRHGSPQSRHQRREQPEGPGGNRSREAAYAWRTPPIRCI